MDHAISKWVSGVDDAKNADVIFIFFVSFDCKRVPPHSAASTQRDCNIDKVDTQGLTACFCGKSRAFATAV